MISSEFFVDSTLLFTPKSRVSLDALLSFKFKNVVYNSIGDFVRKKKNYSFEQLVLAHQKRILENPHIGNFLASFPPIEYFCYCDPDDLLLGSGCSIASHNAQNIESHIGKNIFGLAFLRAFKSIINNQ